MIHDQRVRIVQQQQVQDCRALLPDGQVFQIPETLVPGMGDVELDTDPILHVDRFQCMDLSGIQTGQCFRESRGQAPFPAQQIVFSFANDGNQPPDCKLLRIFDPFRPFLANLGQALQEIPQWLS